MANDLRTIIEFDGDASGAKRAAQAAIEATKDSADKAVSSTEQATAAQLRMQDKAVRQQFNLGDLSLQQYQEHLRKRLQAVEKGTKDELRIRMELTRSMDVLENKGFASMGAGLGAATAGMSQFGAAGQVAGTATNTLSSMMQLAANKAGGMQMAMTGVGAAIAVLMIVYQEMMKRQQAHIDKMNEEIAVTEKQRDKLKANYEARTEYQYKHNLISYALYMQRLVNERNHYAEMTQEWIKYQTKIEEVQAAHNEAYKASAEGQAAERASHLDDIMSLNASAQLNLNDIAARGIQVRQDKEKTAAEIAKMTYRDQYAYLVKQRQYGLINETQFANATVKLSVQKANAELSVYGTMFSNLKTLFKEHTVAYKAFAIAETTINTYKAAQAAWASGAAISPFLGAIAAAAAVAAGIANVAKIVAVDASGGGGSISTPSIATPSMSVSGESTGVAGGRRETGGGSLGSETVSKAPQVVNYTAILNVAGSVIGVDKLAELFDEWNYNSLRALGRA